MDLTFQDLIGGRVAPWIMAAELEAKAGDGDQAKKIDRWKKAEKAKRCIVAAFSNASVAQQVYRRRTAEELEKVKARAIKEDRDWEAAIEAAPDRVQAQLMIHRRHLVEVGGRFIRADQPADPVKAAKKIGRCSTAWGVHKNRQTGVISPHGLGCDDPCCPLCGEDRASERDKSFSPIFSELSDSGSTLVHLTFTLPAIGPRPAWWDHGRPVYVTDQERRRGIWAPVVETVERPVSVEVDDDDDDKGPAPVIRVPFDAPGLRAGSDLDRFRGPGGGDCQAGAEDELDPLTLEGQDLDRFVDVLGQLRNVDGEPVPFSPPLLVFPVGSDAWAPTGGESLADNQARLERAFDLLRKSTKKLSNGQYVRDFWSDNVAGFYRGYEQTGLRFLPLRHFYKIYGENIDLGGTVPTEREFKGELTKGVLIPRWNSHLHALIVLREGVAIQTETTEKTLKSGDVARSTWLSGRLWDLFCEAWAHVAAVDDEISGVVRRPEKRGQAARVVEAETAEDVRDAVREVVKYSYKPAELTDAQRLEVLATLKGKTMHSPGGCLHSSSRPGAAAAALLALFDGLEPKPHQAEALEALREAGGERWRLAQLVFRGKRRARDERPPPPFMFYMPEPVKSAEIEFGDRVLTVDAPDKSEWSPRRIVDENGKPWIPLLVRHLAEEVNTSIEAGNSDGFCLFMLREWDPLNRCWRGPPELADAGLMLAEILSGHCVYEGDRPP